MGRKHRYRLNKLRSKHKLQTEDATNKAPNNPKQESNNAANNEPGSVAEPNLPPCPGNQNEIKNRATDPMKGIKYWVEVIGIVSGIVGVVAIVAQYKEMVRATNATMKAVEVSQEQMGVMQRQLDDAESQQRAFLKVESFQITRTTNMIGQDAVLPGKYNVDVSMVIKNYGATAAIDLRGSGQTISERAEAFNRKYGVTNWLKKWDVGNSRNPQPGNGGASIMPQETFTNKWREGEYDLGDNIYKEFWLSYRDIFGHPWVIGEGGTYNFTNDTFTPDFIDWGKYHDQIQTNK